MAKKPAKTPSRRKPKSQRIHTRRLKQQARKAIVPTK